MKKILLWLIRVVLAVVFIYSGIVKLINPAAFAVNIDNYAILPWFLVSLMSAVLPWLEVICGLAILSGKWLRGAALWIAAMNVVFIIAIASAMIRGLDISCGCHTTSTEGARVGLQKLAEDIVWLVSSLYLYQSACRNSDSS
ncbi:DoxX family membrane protein [candidate division KSB1 bacterium]|nr:DoxX family membrane protein [candidate division KSB1 bacterium]